MSDIALRIHGLALTRGDRTVLERVDLEVRRGELIVVGGASGSGKTTVLRSVAALTPFDAGQIDVGPVTLTGGAQPAAAALRRLRREVGLVFQFHCLFEHLTALENVWLAPVHVGRLPRAAAERRARGLLAELGVDARAHALPRELSGGEAQRVAIARALAMDPPLLLMDEPMASLDPARRAELGGILQRFAQAGRALVVTTHDEGFGRQFATRLVSLEQGVLRDRP